MKRLLPLTLISLLVSTGCIAAELMPLLQGRALGAVIKDVGFPDTLRKDLTSGLTNRILIRVTLLAAERAIDQRAVEIAVKYDLWDETFRMTLTVGETVVATRTYANLEEISAFLANTRLSGLFTPSNPPATELTLKAEMLLNPIEKERLEKIKAWVAQNSIYTPMDPTTAGAGRSATTSTSNAVFNKIFEQYASGSELAAVWKETVASRPFRMGDLPDGGSAR